MTNTTSVGTGARNASLYQQLRGHLAALKLDAAAAALPAVLETATSEKWTMTATLEHWAVSSVVDVGTLDCYAA